MERAFKSFLAEQQRQMDEQYPTTVRLQDGTERTLKHRS